MKNFVEELRWRGMIHDMFPGTEEYMMQHQVAGYVGIDPTADDAPPSTAVRTQAFSAYRWCYRYDWRPINEEC